MKVLVSLFKMTRPYSLIYIGFLGVAGKLTISKIDKFSDLLWFFCLGPSIWILGVVLNDFFHQKKDQLGRKNRMVKKPFFVYGFCLGGILSFLFVSMLSSPATVFYCFLAFLFAGLYGKNKALIGLASLFRGLASGCIILAGSQEWLVPTSVIFLASAITFLDATGNLLGDYRDIKIDGLTNVSTIATRYGKKGLMVVLMFHTVALFFSLLFAPQLYLFWVMIWFLGIICIYLNDSYKHYFYLMLKYLTVFFVMDSIFLISLAPYVIGSMVFSTLMYVWIHEKSFKVSFFKYLIRGS